MSILTVPWDRAENAASYPQDSGIVFPSPKLTVAWGPMLNSSVLDWDPADVLGTPGAGPDVPTPTPTPTTPTDTGTTPPPADPGTPGTPGTPTDPGTPGTPGTPGDTGPAGPGGPSVPSGPCVPGTPDVRVVTRRSLGPFGREGLRFEVIVPSDATVRAVLTWTTREDGKAVRRKLTSTVTKTLRCGKRQPIRLKPTTKAKRLLAGRARTHAVLELVVTYKGAKPVHVREKVLLADTAVRRQ